MRIVVLLMVLLAGCTSSPTPEGTHHSDAAAQAGSAVAVTPADPAKAVAGERGAIQGTVTDLDGSNLAGVRVELVGVATVATTDNVGMYLIDSLAPGDYLLHARHKAYIQVSAHVTVLAGTTTIADVRLAPQGPLEPALVDFWEGRDIVRVADGSYSGSESPLATHCLAGAKTRWAPMPTIRFDAARQLVWPGTAEISVALDWDAATFAGDKLAVVWRNHPDGAYELTPFATRGESIRIALTPEQADFPRQAYTRWELGICARDQSGDHAQLAQSFEGVVRAQVDLVRGHPLPLETPEPTLWSNATRLPVLNESRTFDASDPTLWVVQPCSGPTVQVDGTSKGAGWFRFIPGQGLLVPPGATAIEATLAWSSTDVWGSPVLELAYRSAAIAPWVPDDASTHKSLEPVASGPGQRTYRFPIGSLDTDGWEDAQSAWSFIGSLEGTQHACLDLEVRLQVTAVRDPA